MSETKLNPSHYVFSVRSVTSVVEWICELTDSLSYFMEEILSCHPFRVVRLLIILLSSSHAFGGFACIFLQSGGLALPWRPCKREYGNSNCNR